MISKRVIVRKNLSDQVTSILRKKIILGIYEIGEHLNEASLAKELDISRGPIRESLKVLENEGLVASRSNGRTTVAGFLEQDIEDFYKIRFYYEQEAIKKIISNIECEKNYDSWISDLYKILNSMKEALEVNNLICTDECDYSFHEHIMLQAGSNIFYRMWQSIGGIRTTLMEINNEQLAKESIVSSDEMYSLHQDMLISLKEKDLHKTINLLQKHMDVGVRIYQSIIRLSAQNTA